MRMIFFPDHTIRSPYFFLSPEGVHGRLPRVHGPFRVHRPSGLLALVHHPPTAYQEEEHRGARSSEHYYREQIASRGMLGPGCGLSS
jgi:hypothetical protein